MQQQRHGPTSRALAPALGLVLAALCIPGIRTAAQESKPTPPATVTTPAVVTAPAPADFKLTIKFYGVGTEPITKAELVFQRGVAYYFASEAPEEVLIFDPAAARLELLDLERRVQSEIPRTKLDEKQAVLHRAIEIAIREREEAGQRADRVAAEMSRALIDPALSQTFDAAAGRLRLTNSVVAVEATGAPEPDLARLGSIDTALTVLIELAAVRDPKAIPPFIRLDSLHALTGGHHLRPTELSFVYRLTGPPRKHRWTYALTETITEREREALRRVVGVLGKTPFVSFDKYERREARPATKTK